MKDNIDLRLLEKRKEEEARKKAEEAGKAYKTIQKSYCFFCDIYSIITARCRIEISVFVLFCSVMRFAFNSYHYIRCSYA